MEVVSPSPTHASVEAEQRRFGSQGEASRTVWEIGVPCFRRVRKPPSPQPAIQQRRQRTRVDSIEQRAERAQSSAELGELSSARLALDGASCALRNEQTLRALRDPRRRLVALREDLPDEVQSHQPVVPFQLDHEAVAEFEECPQGPPLVRRG